MTKQKPRYLIHDEAENSHLDEGAKGDANVDESDAPRFRIDFGGTEVVSLSIVLIRAKIVD